MIIGLNGNGPTEEWPFCQMDLKVMGLSDK